MRGRGQGSPAPGGRPPRRKSTAAYRQAAGSRLARLLGISNSQIADREPTPLPTPALLFLLQRLDPEVPPRLRDAAHHRGEGGGGGTPGWSPRVSHSGVAATVRVVGGSGAATPTVGGEHRWAGRSSWRGGLEGPRLSRAGYEGAYPAARCEAALHSTGKLARRPPSGCRGVYHHSSRREHDVTLIPLVSQGAQQHAVLRGGAAVQGCRPGYSRPPPTLSAGLRARRAGNARCAAGERPRLPLLNGMNRMWLAFPLSAAGP